MRLQLDDAGISSGGSDRPFDLQLLGYRLILEQETSTAGSLHEKDGTLMFFVYKEQRLLLFVSMSCAVVQKKFVSLGNSFSRRNSSPKHSSVWSVLL